MEQFEKEISTTNPNIKSLQLNSKSILPKRTIKKRKKYIFVGDSEINRGGIFHIFTIIFRIIHIS